MRTGLLKPLGVVGSGGVAPDNLPAGSYGRVSPFGRTADVLKMAARFVAERKA